MIHPKVKQLKIYQLILGLFICFLTIGYSFSSINPKQVLIHNVRIFDGKQVIPKGDVLFNEGKILRVGENISPPDNTEMIQGDGHTLLPGLIDSHVHIWQEQQLKQSLVFGVTYVVDMFMYPQIMADIKKKQATGNTNHN